MPLVEDTILVKRYRIDRVLAHGRSGTVYRAFDLNLSAPVAIKETSLPDPERLARFKQEAVILTRLRHPALARLWHHFSLADKHYLVMEFIEGPSLAERVEQQGQPLAERQALDYLIQICQAVDYLHRQNPPRLHQDINPGHIKITPAGQAILTGFGLTGQMTGRPNPDQAETAFWPPERHRAEVLTPAADIYSLGAVLYAVLTRTEPPAGAKLAAGRARFEPPQRLNSKLSPQTAQAIMAAVKVDPAGRPQTVAAWQKELAAAAEVLAAGGPAKVPTPAAGEAAETGRHPPPQSPPARSTHWLVDATGLGYPLGSQPLLIGRRPEADIVLDEAGVSPDQTQIRVEGLRCLVRNQGAVGGTLLNGHRLGSEWYPLEPGDLLTIGSARFHLTGTQPAKVAPPKSGSAPVVQSSLSPAPAPVDRPALPARPRGARRFALLLLVILAGLIGLAVFYGTIDLDVLPFSALGSFFAAGASPGQAQTGTVAAGATLAQAGGETDGAPPARPSATPTLARLHGATPPPSLAPTARPVSTTSALAAGPITPTRPLSTATSTITPTRRSPTALPTPSLTRAAPAIAGPTLIPLEAAETIERIGVRDVIDVDINARNPVEVYALVKGDGLYKSSNGGEGPWARLKLDAAGVAAFVIDPTEPTRFYAPTWNGVLKSTDGGNTWQVKTNGLVSNRTVEALVVNPVKPNLLYAGVGEKLVVSTDGGESWSSDGYGVGLGLARLHQILIDPFNADTIYVAGLAAAIYKSTDGGHNFLSMPYNVGQGAYGLAAQPGQRDVFLVGINSAEAAIIKTETAWEFRSVSDGLIFGGADSAYSALTYAPASPNVVYAGSGYEDNRYAKGIFKSVDGGEHWAAINAGLSLNPDFGRPYYVKAIAVHPGDANIVFAATGGGLHKSVDGGANWSLR